MTDEISGPDLTYLRAPASGAGPQVPPVKIRAGRPSRKLTFEEQAEANARRAQARLQEPPLRRGRPRSPDLLDVRPPRLTSAQMRERMTALKMSQAHLCRMMGRSRSAMTKVLARDVVPDYIAAYLDLLRQFDALTRRTVPMDELKRVVFEYHVAMAAGHPPTTEGCAWRLGLPVGVVHDVIEALKAEGVLV